MEPTICKECKFYPYNKQPGWFLGPKDFLIGCQNPNAPVTNFVLGEKELMVINHGKCKFFKQLPQEEGK